MSNSQTYAVNWQPKGDGSRRSVLQIRTSSGRFVAIVSHAREVAAAIAAYEAVAS